MVVEAAMLVKAVAVVAIILVTLFFVLPLAGFKFWDYLYEAEKVPFKEATIPTEGALPESANWFDYSGYTYSEPDTGLDEPGLTDYLNTPVVSSDCSGCSGCKLFAGSTDEYDNCTDCSSCKYGSSNYPGKFCESCWTGAVGDPFCAASSICCKSCLPQSGGKNITDMCDKMKSGIVTAKATNSSYVLDEIPLNGKFDVISDIQASLFQTLKKCDGNTVDLGDGTSCTLNTSAEDEYKYITSSKLSWIPSSFTCRQRDPTNTPCPSWSHDYGPPYGTKTFGCIKTDGTNPDRDAAGNILCPDLQQVTLNPIFPGKVAVTITPGGQCGCKVYYWICKGGCGINAHTGNWPPAAGLKWCSESPLAGECVIGRIDREDEVQTDGQGNEICVPKIGNCKVGEPCTAVFDYAAQGPLELIEVYGYWFGGVGRIGCSGPIDSIHVTAFSSQAFSYPICEAKSMDAQNRLHGIFFPYSFTDESPGGSANLGNLKLSLDWIRRDAKGYCRYALYGCPARTFADSGDSATIKLMDSIRWLDPTSFVKTDEKTIWACGLCQDAMHADTTFATTNWIDVELDRDYTTDEILRAIQTGVDDWMTVNYPGLYTDTGDKWLSATYNTGFPDSWNYNVKITGDALTSKWDEGCWRQDIVESMAAAYMKRDSPSVSGIGAHWTLDEGSGTTAADSSGAGHTGTLRSGATWVPGYSGSAISFPSGGWVNVPRVISTDTFKQITKDLNVEFYVKSSTQQYSTNIIGIDGSWRVYTIGSGSTPAGLVFEITSTEPNAYTSQIVGNVWDGNWHKVRATFDGENIGLLVDDTRGGTTSIGKSVQISYPAFTTYPPLFIGTVATAGPPYYTGMIDEVSISGPFSGVTNVPTTNNYTTSKFILGGCPNNICSGHLRARLGFISRPESPPKWQLVPVVMFCSK